MKTRPILLSLLLHIPVAHAGEAVDKTLDVRPDGWVRIDNVRGRIEVDGWEKDQVSIEGTLDDEAERLVFETDGATTIWPPLAALIKDCSETPARLASPAI